MLLLLTILSIIFVWWFGEFLPMDSTWDSPDKDILEDPVSEGKMKITNSSNNNVKCQQQHSTRSVTKLIRTELTASISEPLEKEILEVSIPRGKMSTGSSNPNNYVCQQRRCDDKKLMRKRRTVSFASEENMLQVKIFERSPEETFDVYSMNIDDMLRVKLEIKTGFSDTVKRMKILKDAWETTIIESEETTTLDCIYYKFITPMKEILRELNVFQSRFQNECLIRLEEQCPKDSYEEECHEDDTIDFKEVKDDIERWVNAAEELSANMKWGAASIQSTTTRKEITASTDPISVVVEETGTIAGPIVSSRGGTTGAVATTVSSSTGSTIDDGVSNGSSPVPCRRSERLKSKPRVTYRY